MVPPRLPTLPSLLKRKLYKTGQTRGAEPGEIYQNRVLRNSTVLIPYEFWAECRFPDDGSSAYESGSIALVEPSWYFETANADDILAADGVQIGENGLLLFLRRSDWSKYAPTSGVLPNGKMFTPGTQRLAPIGGTYIARLHATTADGDREEMHGYSVTALRGAGIRVYEYASSETIKAARLQLEALIWHCVDSVGAMVEAGMTADDAKHRRDAQIAAASAGGLLDYGRLTNARLLDEKHFTICPLCLERISAADFMKRGEQAAGRETWDITITELGLFHIEELRVGQLQHKPYNLGWGHHFCNVVVKDAGIIPTLRWMKRVLENNGDSWEAIKQEAASVEEGVEG